MKVGVSVTMINPGTRPDDEIYQEELSLIDLIEPLGFDSLICVEHHFTGYAMIPNNTQLLAYVAGTHQVAYNWSPRSSSCRGTTRFGSPRRWRRSTCCPAAGPSSVSAAARPRPNTRAFGVPIEESRHRFKEAGEIVIKGLTQERFSYEGKYLPYPRNQHPAASDVTSGAPLLCRVDQPGISRHHGATWVSASSSSRKRTGTAPKPTCTATAQTATSVGLKPRTPICVCQVMVGDDHAEVWDEAPKYFGRTFKAINDHYGFTQGKLQGVKDFEFHARFEKTFGKLTNDAAAQAKALNYFMKLHVVGTASECLEQIEAIYKKMEMEHFGFTFSFGGMPRARVERSMRLFADRVLPVLHHDPAFKAGEIFA